MDLLHHLEELATSLNRDEQDREPSPEDLIRWESLFGYSACEASDIIVKLRENINTHRLSDDQWNIIKASERLAEGHDRESYEHQLQLWSSKPTSKPVGPSTSNITSSYIFKLGEPFTDVETLRRLVGVLAEARQGRAEEDDHHAEFARVNGKEKRVIEEWLESQSIPATKRPTFILLSQSPKELSDTSSHPTIGIDSSLPQHRPRDLDHSFAPAQSEYPVWYFFYGTLMDPHTLQSCISLPHLPDLIPASIRGGRLRSWRHKYKALVDASTDDDDDDDAAVEGFAYRVESSDQEDCLRFRETQAYEVVRCRIFLRVGGAAAAEEEEVEGIAGLTFRFRDVGELDY
ncbi:MAG: hypothetical protein Q9216_003094 [Gyalolechia sp. 2 TL-2023]